MSEMNELNSMKLCRGCTELFPYKGGKQICNVCRKIEEEQFTKIREYIRTNPKSTFMGCSEETGVPLEKIEEFINEGRLVLAPSKR
ncbi:MAG: hypothetical protein ATN36_00910 [Epulopiscium sp. Nele67-Bin005]|nr:MAG: hypothetical protein ATN36_00910 [Epulopiscium sp. Nele67-Bin005]